MHYYCMQEMEHAWRRGVHAWACRAIAIVDDVARRFAFFGVSSVGGLSFWGARRRPVSRSTTAESLMEHLGRLHTEDSRRLPLPP